MTSHCSSNNPIELCHRLLGQFHYEFFVNLLSSRKCFLFASLTLYFFSSTVLLPLMSFTAVWWSVLTCRFVQFWHHISGLKTEITSSTKHRSRKKVSKSPRNLFCLETKMFVVGVKRNECWDIASGQALFRCGTFARDVYHLMRREEKFVRKSRKSLRSIEIVRCIIYVCLLCSAHTTARRRIVE